ncbi:hypothetical protein [Kamptonema formosum]|uniref:hypothetical protein n=1 Tax=Kamptonema formosum TaxID=331992 RepID=UPI00036E92D3|nr:hypothetical protein [Oscillatoria sp. PCC 10802]
MANQTPKSVKRYMIVCGTCGSYPKPTAESGDIEAGIPLAAGRAHRHEAGCAAIPKKQFPLQGANRHLFPDCTFTGVQG